MRILIDIGHPAHVHLFKNFIRLMENKGHEFKVTARDKDVAISLLKANDISFEVVENKNISLPIFCEWAYREIKILQIAKEFDPDLFLGTLNPVISLTGKLFDKPSVIFTDYEPDAIKYPLGYITTTPFVDNILIPSSVNYDYGEKAFRIQSFKELAYLHPSNFNPNPKYLEEIGVKEEENFTILRFISWDAHHDVGKFGFNRKEKKELIEKLDEYSKVYVSSEDTLPEELKKYELEIKPEYLHHLLYYANLLVCDSQTMATEGAVLGTPSIRCNSFAGENEWGNFKELEEKYDLLFNYKHSKEAINKALDIVKKGNLNKKWSEKRERLLNDKIDLTSFMVWFIENYPQSVRKMKENNNIQYKFK